jgi:hypothetical protein
MSAKPIDQIGLNELTPTLKALARAGGTTKHADWIRSGFNASLLLQFIDQTIDNENVSLLVRNPLEMSISEQLLELIRANDEGEWGVTDHDIARLAATAPSWPIGKHAYRSLRIRFGEGDDGVALTFERHVARIRSVFGEIGFWRWEHLRSGRVTYKGKPVERLRLLNGNHTHKPVIEWVIVDLDTHRKRDSITAVRGIKSLADELLVIAWMFPNMIRAIDYDKLPGFFAAGYESNASEYDDDDSWWYVVIVDFEIICRQVNVDADDRYNNFSDYSVPVLL